MHLPSFLLGVVTPFLVVLIGRLIERARDWLRAARGNPCPECKDDGYIEDVDIDARSVSQWPCRCTKGRAFAKLLKERAERSGGISN